MNNHNNQSRGLGLPSPFSNSAGMMQSMGMNNQQPTHLLPQQVRTPNQIGSAAFPGHFRLSEPQAQVLGQSPAAHTRFQSANSPSVGQFSNPTSGNNVGAASSPVSTPATSNPKRSSQKPPSRPVGGSSNANAASLFKSMELAPAPRRKKQKLPENQIPDRVAAILPESALYSQLLEFEARLDAIMMRKKMEIQESAKNPLHVRKTLRVYVFNTFENQSQGVTADKNVGPPSWSLKIIGRILEDGEDPVLAGIEQKAYPKFSSFFKKIAIYLDQNLYPDNHVILWESARSAALHEGFEVKRKGDKEFTAIIRLEMNHMPEKLRLLPPLSEILGIEVETRQRILAAMWQYVKSKNLQNLNDPASITCDPPLQKLFGEEKMKLTLLPQRISQYLTSVPPFQWQHKVILSGNSPAGTACYDIELDVPFPLQNDFTTLLANTEKNKEIDACDEIIHGAIKKIHEHRCRRAFLLGFSQSPAEFINALVASQGKDLKIVAGDSGRSTDKERRSEFYNQPWVEDAVIRYINRKSASNDAPATA